MANNRKVSAAVSAADGGDDDRISHLPDAMLGTIISLLPTKEGARTQILSRRWRPLWRRAAPLNLQIEYGFCVYELMTIAVVSRILADHPGPARCFSYPFIRYHRADEAAQIQSWFHAPALTGLQELSISFSPFESVPEMRYPLPASILQHAPTLVVAEIGVCIFPTGIAALPLEFPLLKQLTLYRVSISEEVLHAVLSGCRVLETLLLKEVYVVSGCIRVMSQTVRSIGFCPSRLGNAGLLVIEEAPLLERLLIVYPGSAGESIRIINAPKLEMIGPLSPYISQLQIANNLVLQVMIPAARLINSSFTVKVLALQFVGPCLCAVLDIIRCFPCLEKLYVTLNSYGEMDMRNARPYDPLDPINCLETCLEKIVLNNYVGHELDIGFAQFFVLNAKVLKEIKFAVNMEVQQSWLAAQHILLGVEYRASQDAQFKFRTGRSYLGNSLDTHDLSIADPFDHAFEAAVSGEADP